MGCGPKEKGDGKGSCELLNGELEVRESSLSYVIGSMNNDPCGQVMVGIEYGLAGDGRTRWRQWPGHLISKSVLLKIPGIDFKAGAGMFSALAFIELIPRGSHHREITSHSNAWMLAEPEKKKLLFLRFSLSNVWP
jgi:hypothetical protein